LTLFDEGKEAEFFGSMEELIDKSRFYLLRAEARQRIARSGRERSLRSGYDNESRLSEMLARAVEVKRGC
jgi:spore maturation protein CgeB